MKLTDLPLETLYLILGELSTEEKYTCRLVNKRLMLAASCIFRVLRLKTRADVEFFSKTLERAPSIGTNVKTILVSSAAVLRAASASLIRRYCTNVIEIDIVGDQGRGTWGQYMQHFTHLRNAPAFENDKNAELVLRVFKDQLSSLKLGGPLLISFTPPQLHGLLSMMSKLKRLELLYPFQDRLSEPYRDFKGSLKFEAINQLISSPHHVTTLVIANCELSNVSLLNLKRPILSERIISLRQEILGSYSLNNLFTSCGYLTHLKLEHVMVHCIPQLMRSILDNFTSLVSLNIRFVRRGLRVFDILGEGFYNPDDEIWEKPLNYVSKLKTLSLVATQSRLTVHKLLSCLGEANAPIEDLTIKETLDREDETIQVITTYFSDTLRRIHIECRGATEDLDIGLFPNLTSYSFYLSRGTLGTFFQPQIIFMDGPLLTHLSLGYINNFGSLFSLSYRFALAHYHLTTLRLDKIVVHQSLVRQMLLPLVNLKEVIFDHCIFEYLGLESEIDFDDLIEPEYETFNFWPKEKSHLQEEVEETFFDHLNREDDPEAHKPKQTEPDDCQSDNSTESYPVEYRSFHIHQIHQIYLRSLSLQHLGIHDCKLREQQQGLHTAKTARNFEVILDERSGCEETYNIDRAVHEKKKCNPRIILNKTTRGHGVVSYHFTHEFGGTLGRNNYQKCRPTFSIRLFSLDKLSIRHNNLMSIYFKNKNQSRLNTCRQIVSKLVDEAAQLEH